MSQPPVPENLRALARQQLHAEPASGLHSLRKRLRQHAQAARQIQEVIIVRTKCANATPFVDGGWSNAGEWSVLLAEFDQSVNVLRAAWQ